MDVLIAVDASIVFYSPIELFFQLPFKPQNHQGRGAANVVVERGAVRWNLRS